MTPPELWALSLALILGFLALLAAIAWRCGVRYGTRRTIVDAKRAYEHGRLVGRREERCDWIVRGHTDV